MDLRNIDEKFRQMVVKEAESRPAGKQTNIDHPDI
jgi:hypothetical protein